jgi:gluconokinase
MPGRAPEILVLALDIGSSSTRSALFDEKGRPVPGTDVRREYSITYRPDGGAELSPARLQRAVRACLRKTLEAHRSSRLKKMPITAVSGSAFWHGLLGLDRSGHPETPILTWADSRSQREAAGLRGLFDERQIHAQTGCMLRASFWPAKLRWIRRTDRQLFRRVGRWVSPATWIFEKIFETNATSHSMASATGLYDWRSRNWHQRLCEACEVDPQKLGNIDDAEHRGTRFTQLRDSAVFGPIGDGAASNLGCDATSDGRLALNIGTSAALRVTEIGAGGAVPFGLFRYAIDERRAVIGGAVSNAGNLHRWCTEQLRMDGPEEKALDRRAATTDPLTVLPFWVAERAPDWPEDRAGAIIGLTQATDAAAIFRAAICATFYRLGAILTLLEGTGRRASEIIVSGGVLHSPASLNLLADVLGRDLRISPQAEASLRGAAVYALERVGRQPAPINKHKLVRHERVLTKRHRRRQAAQAALEFNLAKS